jgi:serine/tyrosine/threonine adenylyltransferase
MTWINRINLLGPSFTTEVMPTPVPEPGWVAQNFKLGQDLGLPDEWLNGTEGLAVFSGNGLWEGMQARASVYSGHQFGQWAGQLGDGRALSLGEYASHKGTVEIQLKGAGKTPYSRMGDGRAVLRSSIREYLCSEAMAGLGIPTTRALCLTGSPLPILREELETAAIVTRTSPSFIRFGHFEHFANHASPQGIEHLKQLADFVISNHFQTEDFSSNNPYATLLEKVSVSTARLIAQWQAVGFCHGVMNTDNMSILGLTLDYGPFQFLDGFNPQHICNHSDSMGRYAYDRQPQVAYWNLFCLAQALMPLIEEQDLAMKALEPYKTAFAESWEIGFLNKLGMEKQQDPVLASDDKTLLNDVLQLLANEQVDFTIFWRRLSHAAPTTQATSSEWQAVADVFIDQSAWGEWRDRYLSRLQKRPSDMAVRQMLQVNPKYVLRNHLAEAAIQKSKKGDHSEVETLFKLLQSPFEEHSQFEHYANLPPDWAASIEISCSS